MFNMYNGVCSNCIEKIDNERFECCVCGEELCDDCVKNNCGNKCCEDCYELVDYLDEPEDDEEDCNLNTVFNSTEWLKVK